jgi:L-fuconolactonase
VVECFGFDRVIHDGDGFVMAFASIYPRWIETLDWALAGCSEDELRKFSIENARALL